MPPPSQSPESKITDMIIAAAVAIIAIGILGAVFAAVLDWYAGVISWFYSFNWAFWKIVIMALIIGADIFLFAVMIVLAQRYARLNRETPSGEAIVDIAPKTEEVGQLMGEIRALAASSNPSDWHMALLRADAQLDELLRHRGYEGTMLAERLSIVDPYAMPSLDKVWSAHRLRNAIAHDPLAQYSKDSITSAISAYEQAFQELGYLRESPDGTPPDEIIRNI